MYSLSDNLQGGFTGVFFANSSPTDFLKAARRLARGGRRHSQKESDFSKFPSRGAAATRGEGWRASFSVSASSDECRCLSVSTSPWCSQDSRPGHRSVEYRGRQAAGASP